MQKYIEILLEGDEKATGEWVSFGKAKVNAIRATGVKHAVRTYPVTDRITVYVRVGPQYDRIRIVEGGCDAMETGLVDTYTLWPRGNVDVKTNTTIAGIEQEGVADGAKPKFWAVAKYSVPEGQAPKVTAVKSTILPPKSENEGWLRHYLRHYPSLYSGKMRKLAQCSLGTEYWDGSTSERTFPFFPSWPITHGLYTTTDDRIWGLQVDNEGVWRFPVQVCRTKYKHNPRDKNEVAVEALILIDAQKDKKVLIGAKPATVKGSPLFNGWAFSESGRQISHCLMDGDEYARRVSHHWRIDITEGVINAGTPDERRAPVQAVYTEVSVGQFWANYDSASVGLLHLPFGLPDEERYTVSTESFDSPVPIGEGINNSATVYTWFEGETERKVNFAYTSGRNFPAEAINVPTQTDCTGASLMRFGRVSGTLQATQLASMIFTMDEQPASFGGTRETYVGTTIEDIGPVPLDPEYTYPLVATLSVSGANPCGTNAQLEYTNETTGVKSNFESPAVRYYPMYYAKRFTSTEVSAYNSFISSLTLPLFERCAVIIAIQDTRVTASYNRAAQPDFDVYADQDQAPQFFGDIFQAPEFRTDPIVPFYRDRGGAMLERCDVISLSKNEGSITSNVFGKRYMGTNSYILYRLITAESNFCFTSYTQQTKSMGFGSRPAEGVLPAQETVSKDVRVESIGGVRSITGDDAGTYFTIHLPAPAEFYRPRMAFGAYKPMEFKYIMVGGGVVELKGVTYTPQYLTQGWIGAV